MRFIAGKRDHFTPFIDIPKAFTAVPTPLGGASFQRMSAILLVVVVVEFEFKYFIGSICYLWRNK